MRGTVRHGHLFVSLKVEILAQCLTRRRHSGFCGMQNSCQRKGTRLRITHFGFQSCVIPNQPQLWLRTCGFPALVLVFFLGKVKGDWGTGLQTVFSLDSFFDYILHGSPFHREDRQLLPSRQPVLVPHGTTGIYSPSVLEARSPKSKCWPCSLRRL